MYKVQYLDWAQDKYLDFDENASIMVCQKSVRCHCEVIASIGFFSLSAPGYALVKHFNLGVYKEAPVHSPLRRVGSALYI